MHGRTLVLLVTTLVACAFGRAADAEPNRRVLSMRSAERAIDLAWQAELAGDYKGARESLVRLVETATTSVEASARQLLNAWLGAVRVREQAFARGGKSAHAYRAAFATLEDFGLERSAALWAKANRELPALHETETTSVAMRLRTEAIRGPVNRAVVERHVSDFLRRHGFKLEPAPASRARYELRLDLDATDAETGSRSSRVTARVTIVVRDASDRAQKARAPAVGNVAKQRTERRRTEPEARAFAVRRALDDASASVLFVVRLHALDALARRDGAKG